MLVLWARQSNTSLQLSEEYGDVADIALTRAWIALTPDHFGRFAGLPALLGYLRTCVSATLIDIRRSQTSRERALKRLEVGGVATPEELVIDQLEREELWQQINQIELSRAERVVLIEYYLYDLPPRAIRARHRDLFSTILAVYAAQRSLKARLQRSLDLKRLKEG
jgi:DNA-directed RNA polymerase specialized sigma24 family protein